VVLVDHGLYKKLDPDFQESYARLWKGIVMANIPEIKCACERMGVVNMVSEILLMHDYSCMTHVHSPVYFPYTYESTLYWQQC
jgi:predicted unusual protein kinase regulating ubiquinone biosynthesis (AarF/ABC1/UbiB family)